MSQVSPLDRIHVRLDAAGQYAANLEQFLRDLTLPITLSIGEPKRNKDYQKAHFPKRTPDDTESQAMARFAQKWRRRLPSDVRGLPERILSYMARRRESAQV